MDYFIVGIILLTFFIGCISLGCLAAFIISSIVMVIIKLIPKKYVKIKDINSIYYQNIIKTSDKNGSKYIIKNLKLIKKFEAYSYNHIGMFIYKFKYNKLIYSICFRTKSKNSDIPHMSIIIIHKDRECNYADRCNHANKMNLFQKEIETTKLINPQALANIVNYIIQNGGSKIV